MQQHSSSPVVDGVICGGRTARQVAGAVRNEIIGGRFPVGTFLPSLRDLAAKHAVAQMTVRRALGLLRQEGLLVTEARRGYRVISARAGTHLTQPVAHVTFYGLDVDSDQARHQITPALQRALARYGSPMLSIAASNHSPEQILDQIRSAQAWGVTLDADVPDLAAVVQKAGLPVIQINEWREDTLFDVVHQDNYVGGYLAARHLVQRGCRRIAWLGPVGRTCVSRERFAGALAALQEAGLELPAERQFDTKGKVPSDVVADQLLTSTPRPDGVLALWTDLSLVLAAAMRRRRIVPGRGLPMVGWTIVERYDEVRRSFSGAPIPPMIVWDVEDMARLAVTQLIQRRLDPCMPRARINVAVTLRPADVQN